MVQVVSVCNECIRVIETNIVATSHAVSLSLRSYLICFSTIDAEKLGRVSPSNCYINVVSEHMFGILMREAYHASLDITVEAREELGETGRPLHCLFLPRSQWYGKVLDEWEELDQVSVHVTSAHNLLREVMQRVHSWVRDVLERRVVIGNR